MTPNNPIPYRWSYDLTLLRKSLELDPNDPIALDLFGVMLMNRISINLHEIHAGFAYNGDPNEDLELIKYYDTLLGNVGDPVNVARIFGN